MTADITTLSNDHLSLAVSDLGAEMQRLTTHDGRDLLWDGDAAYWSGRAPILFPIVGRAADNRIAVGPFEAEMAQHGFARRSVFALEDASQDMCRHVLSDTEVTRAIYPFSFALRVTHQLRGGAVKVRVEIENCDDQDMPFGFGFHPAFRWPLPGAKGQPHQIILDNGAEPALTRLEGGLLPDHVQASPFKAGKLTISSDQFHDDAMIFPEGAGEGLSFGVENGPQLKFKFENLPNLALWSKPGAPFLCVEPWHGMAARAGASAQISDRPYSVALASGKSAQFGYQVEVQL